MSTDKKKDTVDGLMAEVHELQCKALIKKLKDGDISAPELQAVTAFLKANGITSDIHRDKNLSGVVNAFDEKEADGTIEFTQEDLGIPDDRITM